MILDRSVTAVVAWFADGKHRAYVYRVLAAAGVVAAGVGVLTGEQVALWLGFASTVLGTGTAVAYTSTKR